MLEVHEVPSSVGDRRLKLRMNASISCLAEMWIVMPDTVMWPVSSSVLLLWKLVVAFLGAEWV